MLYMRLIWFGDYPRSNFKLTRMMIHSHISFGKRARMQYSLHKNKNPVIGDKKFPSGATSDKRRGLAATVGCVGGSYSLTYNLIYSIIKEKEVKYVLRII